MEQDEKETAENKDKFKERFGEEPRREDLVVMVPKRVRLPPRQAGPPAASVHVCMVQAATDDWYECCSQDDPNDQIFVFFPDDPKVGVKTIKLLAERMRNENVQRAVMVVQSAMTPFARQCLNEMAPKYTIELVRVRREGLWMPLPAPLVLRGIAPPASSRCQQVRPCWGARNRCYSHSSHADA